MANSNKSDSNKTNVGSSAGPKTTLFDSVNDYIKYNQLTESIDENKLSSYYTRETVSADYVKNNTKSATGSVKGGKIKKSKKTGYSKLSIDKRYEDRYTKTGKFKSKSFGMGNGKKPLNSNELEEMYQINKRTVKTSNINAITDEKDRSADINKILSQLNKTLHLPPLNDDSQSAFNRQTEYYNRFKMPEFDSMLRAGFAHVFFVKPQCNILTAKNELTDDLKRNDLFQYAYLSNKNILKELSKYGGRSDDFMLSLSNNVNGFTVNEENIGTERMGKTYTGHAINYGKNDIESKSASSISIEFRDDRDFHIYQIHKLWVEYINGVYQGLINPTKDDIYNRVLDYTGAIYYIITAEDGETILFWSKYYGVFPSTIPSDQLSWNSGNVLRGSEMRLNVTYQYSWKDDYNPYIIEEFNNNANLSGKIVYAPVYDPKVLHSGITWVGRPYIETVSTAGDKAKDFRFRLRFVEPAKIIS